MFLLLLSNYKRGMIDWAIPYTCEQQIKLQEWRSETKNFVSSSQEDYFYHPLQNFVLICIVLVLISWSTFTFGRMRQLVAPLPVTVLTRRNKGAFSIKPGFPGAVLTNCLCSVLRDSASSTRRFLLPWIGRAQPLSARRFGLLLHQLLVIALQFKFVVSTNVVGTMLLGP